uniref:Peptide transporter At1g52190 family n=1 Tax=Cajanus cajan TaxID=3821 RepID=A0A151SMP5_CAJCA|nr:putative peptide transporter At1g52190 family [Cajanus cajan]
MTKRETLEDDEECLLKNENSGTDDDPRINYRGWKVMPFIIGNEIFEKLGAIGTLSNLLVYLTTVFNLENITATNIINVFNGSTNFATLLGAFLSDAFFGRYKILAFCTVASFAVNCCFLVPSSLKCILFVYGKTHHRPTEGQMTFLKTGLGLLLVGAAGIRPCNLAFGADQFNPNTDSGKKGINSFFNWYFFTFTVAQLISLTIIVYIQSNVSWAVGLGIPAALMFLSSIIFFMGAKMYVKVKPSGSPITSIVQVIVVAIKKRRLKLPDYQYPSLFNYVAPKSMNSKLPYTYQFRFLDKAAIMTPQDQINPNGSATDPWNLCSMQQVEEVKCLLRVLPIWVSGILYFVVIVQQHTILVFQALLSDRRIGQSSFLIPGASYYVFLMITVAIWLPIYDRKVVPLLQRLTGKEVGITLLQRMGIAIFFSILSMLVSARVEQHRRSLALIKPLGMVTRKVEFYYKQFPENMRSIAGSLYYCGHAGSSYLSSVLISVIPQITANSETGNWLPEDLNMGRLDNFYCLIAALEIMNLGYFVLCARWFRYKGSCSSSIELEKAAKQSERSANGVNDSSL